MSSFLSLKKQAISSLGPKFAALAGIKILTLNMLTAFWIGLDIVLFVGAAQFVAGLRLIVGRFRVALRVGESHPRTQLVLGSSVEPRYVAGVNHVPHRICLKLLNFLMRFSEYF